MKGLMIPKKNDWQGFENDLDLQLMHKNIFGKTNDQIYHYYKNGLCISMSHDLLVSSRNVFQYYIFSYVVYLLSALGNHDDEGKEVFLRLLLEREDKDNGSVSQIFNKQFDIYYIDDEFNKHDFHISIEQMVEKIKIQYKNSEIDNWLYDELPELFLKLDKLCKCNQ